MYKITRREVVAGPELSRKFDRGLTRIVHYDMYTEVKHAKSCDVRAVPAALQIAWYRSTPTSSDGAGRRAHFAEHDHVRLSQH